MATKHEVGAATIVLGFALLLSPLIAQKIAVEIIKKPEAAPSILLGTLLFLGGLVILAGIATFFIKEK